MVMRHTYKRHISFFWAVLCAVFWKVCNKSSYEPKDFAWNIEYGNQKTQVLMLISNSLKTLQKIYRPKKFAQSYLKPKTQFFAWTFLQPFERIRNQHKILHFYALIWLHNNIFLLILALFRDFEETQTKRLKKTKRVYYKLLLELNLATLNGVG